MACLLLTLLCSHAEDAGALAVIIFDSDESNAEVLTQLWSF